jgi:hypothetical protein
MSTPYDNVNSGGLVQGPATYVKTSSTLNYPDSEMYNVFGPLFLPKVYGKDLSAFEIASSGYIAVTLNDVYAFNLTRDDNTNTVQLNTTYDGNMLMSTGSNAYISLSATNSNALVKAGKDIVQNAGRAFYAYGSSNTSLSMDGATSNISIKSADSIGIAADWTVSETAAGSNAYLLLDGRNSNVKLGAASNLYVKAGDTIDMQCKTFALGGSNIRLGNSNAYMWINNSNIDYFSSNQMHFMVSNNTIYENKFGFTLTSSNLAVTTKNTSLNTDLLGIVATQDAALAAGGSVRLSACNVFTAVGANALNLANEDAAHTKVSLTSKNMVVSMDTAEFGANTEVLRVNDQGVTIRGLLRVDGDMQTINTYAENLELFDKTITLAGAGMCNFTDGGLTNDRSGLKVGGLPQGMLFTNADHLAMYEKSFLFHCPQSDSMLKMWNSSNVSSIDSFNAESYWELKGGDFRITKMKAANDLLTFAFRVNAYDELELVKKYSPLANGTYVTKVVSKFGRIITH